MTQAAQRPALFSKDMALVLRAASLAGLVGGIAAARATVIGSTLDLRTLALAAATLAAYVLLNIAAWGLPAWVAHRFVGPRWGFVAAFGTWTLVVVVGRLRLAEHLLPASWWLLAVGIGLALAAEIALGRSSSAREALALAGTVSVAIFALLGRLPDQSLAVLDRGLFLVTAVLAAAVLLAAALRMPKILALGAAALVLGVVALGRPTPPREGPNVLWVLCDTTRADHLQPFGDLVETPAIAQLAGAGVSFDNAVTVVPKTPASVASMFTGRLPWAHGVRSLYDPLGDELVTVAELFEDAGYETRALVNNAWLTEGRGFGQGFGRFDDHADLNNPYGPLAYDPWVLAADQLGPRALTPFSGQTWPARVTDAAIEFLEKRGDRPFFLYAHYFHPHWPYYPLPSLVSKYGGPPRADTPVNNIHRAEVSQGEMVFQNPFSDQDNEAARGLYRSEIDGTMRSVGRLLGELERLDLADDTLVVFTADHGHSLGEHRYWFHHGEFLYDATTLIPLVLSWPGRIPAGRRIASQVRSIDIAPTVLELAGIGAPRWSQGQSLQPLWSGGPGEDLPAFLESDIGMFSSNTRRELAGIVGKLRALRDDGYKLILTPTRSGPVYELYDLGADPGEEHNLIGDPEHAELAATLRGRLLALIPPLELDLIERAPFLLSPAPDGEQPASEVDQETLRSLGYVN